MNVKSSIIVEQVERQKEFEEWVENEVGIGKVHYEKKDSGWREGKRY